MARLRLAVALLLSLAGAFAGLVSEASAETPADTKDAADLAHLAERAAGDSIDLLQGLLRLPNDANVPGQVDANVDWMEQAFRSRGFAVRRLATPTVPLLLAEHPVEGAERTILVYLQVDGQPVDPARWDQDDPYEPVLVAQGEEHGAERVELPWSRLETPAPEWNPEWRIYARSSADAKGPVAMFLAALDVAREEGFERAWNLKVIMDFEEELGSPHLPTAVAQHREALAADALIIFDGPRHASNRPTLYFGARGIATITLTVFGPRVPQHSGHYGNYTPNPAQRLARLLAAMKDDDGRVLLPGFYDGVELDEETRRILAAIPDDEDEIRRRLGIAEPDAVAESYQESIQYPSLNVRGMAAGWVGDAVRTIVPDRATAEIDLRLVPEVDPDRLVGLVRAHVEAAGYHLIEGREPTDAERLAHPRIASFTSAVSYQAFRTPYDGDTGRWLSVALERAFGEEPVRIRMLGGSIPISPFVTTLGVPAVGVPGVQLDNNQHSPNENLRVGNYIDGIRTYLAILTEPFPEPSR